MKKFIIIIITIFTFFPITYVRAESLTQQMINEEQETFGINDFAQETEKYTNEFFNDMNISDIINSAITGKINNNKILNKILKIFGKYY